MSKKEEKEEKKKEHARLAEEKKRKLEERKEKRKEKRKQKLKRLPKKEKKKKEVNQKNPRLQQTVTWRSYLSIHVPSSPIGNIIRRHGLNYHLYADDTQLYLSFKSTPAEQAGSISRIEVCVSEIDSWMVSNKLKLNRGKTELLVLSARHRPPPSIEYIDVSGERIKPTSSARNIGVIFDEHMSLDKHVTNICKACFFHLRNISKTRDCLSQADTGKLVHAFITSKLDSANSLLYGLPTFLIDRLQNVQNAAARIMTHTKKYDHIKPVLKQLHWLPVNKRINYKILLLTYKALNGQAPSYITELLDHRLGI